MTQGVHSGALILTHSMEPPLTGGATCLRQWHLLGPLLKCLTTDVSKGAPGLESATGQCWCQGLGTLPPVVPSVFLSTLTGRCRAKQNRDSGKEPASRHLGGRAAGDLWPVRQPGPRAAARGWHHRHRGVPGAPGGPQGLQAPGLFQGRAAQACFPEGVNQAAIETVSAQAWPVGARLKNHGLCPNRGFMPH